MGVLNRTRDINTVVLKKLRSVGLLALLSTLSLSSCSQDEQCIDKEQFVVQDTVPCSPFLDSIPARNKSILYYHIAKDKEGNIDICESIERVLSYKESLTCLIGSYGVPLDTAMALMLTESRGLLDAKSTVGACGPWQIMPKTAKAHDKNYI